MKLDLSPRGVAIVLFKDMRIILGIVITICSAAILYVAVAQSYYQAKATFVVRFDNDIKANMQDSGSSSIKQPVSTDERREVIDSSLQILQSREFAQRIIREFGVERVYPKMSKEEPSYGTIEDAAVSRLIKDIAVKTGTQTNVIDLSVFNPDRDLSVKMLQRLLDLYIAKQADVYENPQVEFTRVQSETARTRLTDLQNKLNGLRSQSGIFDYSQQFPILLKQQDTVITNIAALTSTAAQASGRQERLAGALGVVPTSVINTVDGDQFKELDRLRAQLEEIKGRQQKATGDKAREFDPQIADLERAYQGRLRDIQVRSRPGSGDLYQTILIDYLRASAEAKAAEQAIAFWKVQATDISRQISDMQSYNRQIIDVARETELAETSYKSLAQRAEEAVRSQKLNEQSITRVTLIDAPNVDPKPARPRKYIILIAALFGSIVLGCGVVVIRETLSERVYLPQHIEDALGVEVITSFGRFEPPQRSPRPRRTLVAKRIVEA